MFQVIQSRVGGQQKDVAHPTCTGAVKRFQNALRFLTEIKSLNNKALGLFFCAQNSLTTTTHVPNGCYPFLGIVSVKSPNRRHWRVPV